MKRLHFDFEQFYDNKKNVKIKSDFQNNNMWIISKFIQTIILTHQCQS